MGFMRWGVSMKLHRLVVETTDHKYELLLIVALIVAGLVLRLSIAKFGLPFFYDPDEIAFAEPAINIIASGNWNPGWFGHPGTTTIYLTVAIFEFVHALRSFFLTVPDLANDYYASPYAYTFSARALQALFATATIWLTYRLARKMELAFTPALFAAALVAFSSLHIMYSGLIRTDTLAAFFSLLSLINAVDIAKSGNLRSYMWAGVWAGLAITTKYPLVFCCVIIAIAHLISPNHWLKDWRLLSGAAVSTVAAAFVSSPYLFIDFGTTLLNLSHEARTSHGSATGEGFVGNFTWYLERSRHWFGALAIIGTAAGFMISIITSPRSRMLPAAFFALFLVFISSLNLRWDRWLVPLVPVGAILSAVALHHIFFVYGKRFDLISKLVGLAVAVYGSWHFLDAGMAKVAARTASDTRTAAALWVDNNLPPKSLVLVDDGGPQLSRSKFRVGFYGFGREASKISYVYRNEYENVIPRFSDPARANVSEILRNDPPDYVLLSSRMADRYRDRPEWSRIQAIFDAGEIVHGIKPGSDAQRGPTIWVIGIYNAR